MAQPTEALGEFVRDALGRGLTREAVRKALREAGWAQNQIDSALGTYAQVDFPVPVPRPQPYLSAREAFFYLLLFSTLGITAVNLGSLLFALINAAFPDPELGEEFGEWLAHRVRWNVSAIIIAFPVFLYIARRLRAALVADPGIRASRIRKWLTYLTLFVTAGILIGDLTALVYNLLAGELSMRFVLKFLTVGLISGAIFGYYLWDQRGDEREADSA